MPQYRNIIRFVPNYSLNLEEWVMGIYDWKRLEGLHYTIKGMGKSSKITTKKIEEEDITIHEGVIFYEKHFDCQKDDIDELDIIRKIKGIKKYVWREHHIEFQPYLYSVKLLDKGTAPNFAEILSIWEKRTHMDPRSGLGQLIAPEICPLEPIIIGKKKTNKKGHIKLDKKEILYQINNENPYLKGEKVQNFSHNLGIAMANHGATSVNLFLIARCKGYIEYQTVPIYVSEELCSIEIPKIKNDKLIIKKGD